MTQITMGQYATIGECIITHITGIDIQATHTRLKKKVFEVSDQRGGYW
jgi:hypothetical protein